MTHPPLLPLPLPSPLPIPDRWALNCLQKLVPAAERADWLRTWQAELWFLRHRRRVPRLEGVRALADLYLGLAMDASWLRTESWRRALTGDARALPRRAAWLLRAFDAGGLGTGRKLAGGLRSPRP